MSIRAMQRRMSRQLRIVVYITAGAFIVGLPLVFVPRFGGQGGGRPAAEDAAREVVAKVNGQPVTSGQVARQFERMAGQLLSIYASLGQSISFDQIWPYRLGAMEQAVSEELLVQEAGAEMLSVSRSEVKAKAQQMADEEVARLKGQFSPEEFEQRLAQLVASVEGKYREKVSERWFSDWMTERVLEDSDALQRELLITKLRQKRVGSITATDQDLLARYDRATVREIQVRLGPDGKPERTEEEALARAEALAAQARSGEDFADLAGKESDAPEAAESGGVIEAVSRGMMVPEWEEAVFALAPDEVSDPIKLPWGYVIVRMEKLERELPEDFDSRKQELLLRLVQEKQDRAWADYHQELREKAEIEIVSQEMMAWQALQEGKEEEAIALLQEAAVGPGQQKGLAAATVFYELATLLEARDEWEEAIGAYLSSYDMVARNGGEMPGGRALISISLGQCYERLDDVEEALDWYEIASGASDLPGVHTQLQGIYERLGEEDRAAGEQRWLDEYREAELERQRELEALQEGAGEETVREEGVPSPPEPETP